MDTNTADLVAEICWALQLQQVEGDPGESDNIDDGATIGRR